MHKSLHSRSDVNRVYVEKDQGGRGLMSVEETVNYESNSLKKYREGSPVEFKRIAGKIINASSENGRQEYRNHQKTERKQNWHDKQMNGQHLRQTEDQAAKKTWKTKIEKSINYPKCRLCKQKDETVSHIVSECSKIAQTEYKGPHDKVARPVHWSICKKHELPHTEKWYEHRAEAVLENEKVKLLWDFNVQTDQVLEARRPDLILTNKETKQCQVTDIAIPRDTRVVQKENEKIDKYKELGFEINRLWKVKTKMIPIVIGALGAISIRHIVYLPEVGVNMYFETIQKTTILGTADILRKVLS
ncbi:uncharacterized protein [Watersipora subatra]|uniref:uncharacterized protein n=1 Tax=Watersipora subatra TaxID=2589382 RepID=UPI00355BD9D5